MGRSGIDISVGEARLNEESFGKPPGMFRPGGKGGTGGISSGFSRLKEVDLSTGLLSLLLPMGALPFAKGTSDSMAPPFSLEDCGLLPL